MADIAAALAEIRERYRLLGRSSDIHVNLDGYIDSSEDVPRLLAALDEVLKLADAWEAKGAEIWAQIEPQDCDGAVAGFKAIGAAGYQERAKVLREAISRALLADGPRP